MPTPRPLLLKWIPAFNYFTNNAVHFSRREEKLRVVHVRAVEDWSCDHKPIILQSCGTGMASVDMSTVSLGGISMTSSKHA